MIGNPVVADAARDSEPWPVAAIHLASALFLHRRLTESTDGVLSFAAADRRLLDAAMAAGLTVESL